MLTLIGERCPYCSKFRSPREIVSIGGGKICLQCEQRHIAALDALNAGSFNDRCSECDRTPDQIRATGHKTAVWCVHFENGIYKCMCKPCDAIYVTKRSDLYDGTQFWHELKAA